MNVSTADVQVMGRRRRNGQGTRPGDSSVRLTAETMRALRRYREVHHVRASADVIIGELLTRAITHEVLRLQEKMHTSSQPVT